jgi:two-component system KDP operon response regulator KdpE
MRGRVYFSLLQRGSNRKKENMNRAHILIVDNEPKVVRLVSEMLAAAGFSSRATPHGDKAIEMVALEQPDLVILEPMLAGKIDGFQVVRRLREFTETPVIMLTARAGESDLVRAFDVGADDYVTKPFGTQELLARIRAVLKRSLCAKATPSPIIIECGPLRINLARRNVRLDEREIHLTRTEYNLLHQLAIHTNQVMLHEQLLTAVWGAEYRGDIDYLRAYVRYLRRKLEREPDNPQLIVTQSGVGYMLTCPERQV